MGLDDPLFPKTEIVNGANRTFEAGGLSRLHWSNAAPIRTVFRESFSRQGLPNFNPHSFRHTLSRLGQRLCRTPEELQAWAQNLGHEEAKTTMLNYGHVESHRQAEIIRKLGVAAPSETELEDAIEKLRSYASARRS